MTVSYSMLDDKQFNIIRNTVNSGFRPIFLEPPTIQEKYARWLFSCPLNINEEELDRLIKEKFAGKFI